MADKVRRALHELTARFGRASVTVEEAKQAYRVAVRLTPYVDALKRDDLSAPSLRE